MGSLDSFVLLVTHDKDCNSSDTSERIKGCVVIVLVLMVDTGENSVDIDPCVEEVVGSSLVEMLVELSGRSLWILL